MHWLYASFWVPGDMDTLAGAQQLADISKQPEEGGRGIVEVLERCVVPFDLRELQEEVRTLNSQNLL